MSGLVKRIVRVSIETVRIVHREKVQTMNLSLNK
jgi:hypothetical protein